MRRWLVLLATCLAPLAAAADLEAGAEAPDFLLQGSDGKSYTLAQFTGDDAGGVVLAWFPKAFTPG